MARSIKIDDVKQPGKALPSATSRPILVSDHTDIPPTDPMLASPDSSSGGKDDTPAEPAALSHTARTIEPLTAPTVTSVAHDAPAQKPPADTTETKPPADAEPSEPPTPEAEPASDPAAENTAATITPPTSISGAANDPARTGSDGSAADTDEVAKIRDPDAAISAEEAAAAEAKVKREQELEDVIGSGKYTVPVNALQRKRSRTHTILLCILAVVLLLALLDVVFDMGLVNAPHGVPHTHFFSKG
ncbi:MAG TPA: hypothetical protein VGM08_00770 [Candidatus Saccharimonadales bacterium]|jgi:hypothetical protein